MVLFQFFKGLSFLHLDITLAIALCHNFMKKVKGDETEKREEETKILKRRTSWVKVCMP